MPRNLSAWIDLCVHLTIMLVLIGLLACYHRNLAAMAFVVWLMLAFFARDRSIHRARRFRHYFESIIAGVNESMKVASRDLPIAIIILDIDGRVQWSNKRASKIIGKKLVQDLSFSDIWEDFDLDKIFGVEGEFQTRQEDKTFHIFHTPVVVKNTKMIALYIRDVSDVEELKTEYLMSRTTLIYVQIDNYDEVTSGLSEAELAALMLAVNQQLEAWRESLGGFLRRVSDDQYVVILERAMLDKAIEQKFDVLDKVRQLTGARKIPVTLSMGVAVAEKSPFENSMSELDARAQAGLDLALGRGGDQVTVSIDGKNQFFGGKTKAVEKHSRVRARVIAHALREIMEGSDEIFIMGHHNEDFDCFGAAMGVGLMARHLKKNFHIILSDMNSGIDKFVDVLKSAENYPDEIIRVGEITLGASVSPLLIVVDTHIPHLVAAPGLLEKISRVIVIDHHRRSEKVIKNTLLFYSETAASSASELVTELLMYFSDELKFSKFDATGLYSGIVVDTKNFLVNAGARTFDAVAYLRRNGADPVLVSELFRTDFETTMTLSRAEGRAEYYEGGLLVSTIPTITPNVQIIAAQTADALLRIEGAQMTIVCFQLQPDVVGISARSTGECNVQFIMEQFGGGGHQNVAGAQVRGEHLDDVKDQAILLGRKMIADLEKEKQAQKNSKGEIRQ
ncbi:MAG: DHH family phosphoesterase [Selenomonadaceae bacterium]|nr:DHH family phosphoesterase [Selenomonadaceae bacterium]